MQITWEVIALEGLWRVLVQLNLAGFVTEQVKTFKLRSHILWFVLYMTTFFN